MKPSTTVSTGVPVADSEIDVINVVGDEIGDVDELAEGGELSGGIELSKSVKEVLVGELISNVVLPEVPKLYFDADLIVSESIGTSSWESGEQKEGEEEEEESSWANARVVEVEMGVVPEDYELFAIRYPLVSFELDTFQKQCLYYLSRGQSIFVTAHTSSGKTLIAEFAAYIAEVHQTKMVYTSPIKALSNQKYREFAEKFGSVGILTGDAQINNGAKCVVMTTEILRNMLYRGSNILDNVEFIVFDEIHYLGDRERGVVWEEVIIMLPKHIVLIFLSATSPNAKDMAQWISTTKEKDIYLIGTEKRAVELEHAIYFRRELYTLCQEGKFSHEEYIRAMKAGATNVYKEKHKERLEQAKQKAPIPKSKQKPVNVLESPIHIARDLISRNLAPIVFFDFSKSRIEQSFSMCESLDLTTSEEKQLIKAFIHDALQKLPTADRELPQLTFVIPGLLKGVGLHHSGLLPILKEIIEMLFTTGALRVIFATETLAMGLNMPARTVVLRTHKKYSTETHTYIDVNTNEYTQMAGRAGRRGYDIKGTAILEITGQEILPEETLIRLHTGKPFKIESKFYITPRMILKLLRVKGLSVEEMVRLSFSKSKIECQLRQLLQQQKSLQKAASCLLNTCEHCTTHLYPYFHAYLSHRKSLASIYQAYLLSKYPATSNSAPSTSSASTTPPYLVLTQTGFLSQLITLNHSRQPTAQTFMVLQPRYKAFTPPTTSQAFSLDRPIAALLQDLEPLPDSTPSQEVPIDQLILLTQDMHTPFLIKFQNPTQAEEMSQVLSQWTLLTTTHPANHCPNFNQHYHSFLQEFYLRLQVEQIDRALHNANSTNLAGNNYFGYLLFLQHLDYIDELKNLKLKGKIACEFNTIDCILATEILFSPEVTSLPAAHLIIAALSLTFHEKHQLEEDPLYPSELPRTTRVKLLKPALGIIDQIVYSLTHLFKQYRVPFQAPNHASAGEILMWLEGYSLKEILAASPLSEGVIVKYIKKASEICSEFSIAAKILGSTALAQEIEQVEEGLKRGIVFTPSLYYG
ncbi:antiviral helicase SKI2 [Nematocida homosporus]|uniref:antiviral helicase SKI2 n=1 Tax=Nematocida homosporus TaxID=1912981 RepID=UPI0022200886|nr:antiviral helicase SKI2 [Nematocida homosporus]KAI5184357.1 antiviral helicase SKI2 [Nematocida homosporus]